MNTLTGVSHDDSSDSSPHTSELLVAGAGREAPNINTPPQLSCHRTNHWYIGKLSMLRPCYICVLITKMLQAMPIQGDSEAEKELFKGKQRRLLASCNPPGKLSCAVPSTVASFAAGSSVSRSIAGSAGQSHLSHRHTDFQPTPLIRPQ